MKKATIFVSIVLLAIALGMIMIVPDAHSLGDDITARGGVSTPIPVAIAPSGKLQSALEKQAMALLVSELGLEDGTYEMSVVETAVVDSSARIDIRLTTESELLGVLTEIVHVFALLDGARITALFREPSREFHLLAPKVSPVLLPAERLEAWQKLLAQETKMRMQNVSATDYKLPWEGGVSHLLWQDFNKHYDFSMVTGTLIRAARGGTVLNGIDPYGGYYTRIAHSDGTTYGYYIHFQANTWMKSNGAVVDQGACLASSGATGLATGPHLHFNVTTRSDNAPGCDIDTGCNPPYWVAMTFTEGNLVWGTWSPASQNRSGGCDDNPPPPPGVVSPPPTTPATRTCANGWKEVTGYPENDYPVFTTLNAQTAAESGNSATWVPTLDKAGPYKVEAYIGNHGTQWCDRAISWDTSSAQYLVTYNGNAQTTKTVAQKPLTDQWANLGTFDCPAGTTCRVKLTDVTGEPSLSTTVSFSAVKYTLLAPAVPTGVSASDGTYSDKVRVTWNGSFGATSYQVARAASPGGAKTALGTATGTTFDDTTAGSGTYYYSVRAINSAGNSSYSAENAGSKAASPSAPENVNASDDTYFDKVRVTWTAAPGATSYKVSRATSAAGPKTVLGSPTTTSYDDTSAEPGLTYTYWVQSVSAVGDSTYSASDTGRRQAVLAAPTGVSASDGTHTDKVVITWTAVAEATSYEIYREMQIGGITDALTAVAAPVKIGDSTTTTYDDLTASPGITYSYRVKALNATMSSELSAPDSGSRQSVPIGPHFSGCAADTGNSAIIAFPASISVLGDVPLSIGDELAVFNPDGSRCAGSVTWEGNSVALTVWGDDTQTAGVVDGMLEGEAMKIVLWDKSAGVEYDRVEVTYRQGPGLQGTGIFHANIQEVADVLEVITTVTQEINLSAGWNLISSYVVPENASVSTVFDSIADKMIIAKNNVGQVYWPSLGIDGIGNWQTEQGYYVYMTEAATLSITGMPIDPIATAVALPAGWSIVSYMLDTPMPIEGALDSISANLFLVKNSSGAVYWPSLGINGIGNMVPGQGYQVYLGSAGTLTYPAP